MPSSNMAKMPVMKRSNGSVQLHKAGIVPAFVQLSAAEGRGNGCKRSKRARLPVKQCLKPRQNETLQLAAFLPRALLLHYFLDVADAELYLQAASKTESTSALSTQVSLCLLHACWRTSQPTSPVRMPSSGLSVCLPHPPHMSSGAPCSELPVCNSDAASPIVPVAA
jgi:hypothetical protein